VFEVLPRRINMHLPDKRLLVEGQAQAGAAAAAADSQGGRSSKKRGFAWIRQKAMRTGALLWMHQPVNL
jgi:hypothetical protein